MSIFKCSKCGCAENTALCRYWLRQDGEPALCSECDPKGQRKWHNCFDKVKFIEKGKTMHDVIVDDYVKSKFKVARGGRRRNDTR